MQEKEKAKQILKILNKIYPTTLVPLKHRNKFTLLTSVLLSAQCTDLNVNNVTKNIYPKYNKPEHFVKLGRKKIERLIRSIGIFRIKAKSIYFMSKQLLEEHGGNVPNTFEELEKLPGVGHKTASVVMSQGFGFPAFAVDTHIHRLAQRWGLTNGKNVVQTEKDLKRIFPKKNWSKLHLQIIFYGREHCQARNCYGLTCKICTTCYPNRKNPINIKILGIGNAIVDVICKVEDKYLLDNKLTKSTMKLVDENEFKKLLSTLKIEETVSGGSVANSIVGLSYLGNEAGFIGKISDDDLGQKYEDGLKIENVNYLYSKKKELLSTGTCLILITPDSERTMCTFLGTAGKINANDVDENSIRNSKITFLEGYLWDEGEPKKAFEKAIKHSNKIAMSLSDQFCVERHKSQFLSLVKNKLDITFANEQEVMSLIDTKNFQEVITFGKQIGKIIIITRGKKGSIAIKGNEIFECDSKKDLKIVDLTGAGDLFAAGFLHGLINNLTTEESLLKGTEMSSIIIQKIGARLN
jgi:endonuclease III